MLLQRVWGLLWYVLLTTLYSAASKESDVFVKQPLRVGAWNVQRLGATKMSHPGVVELLVTVIHRYDIIAILEVKDSKEKVPYDLLAAINKDLPSEEQYNLTLSERVGRTSQKEQYVFYWKISRVTEKGTFQYDDSEKDVFTYDPFTVTFESTEAGNLTRFAMTSIHTRPDDAAIEIDALVDVYDQFINKGTLKDMIILGDFNMGCTYITSNDLENIRLHTDPRFTWLIDDHADTTTGTTTCPYDRIVLAGPTIKTSVYPETAVPFFFDEEYEITDQELLEDTSDHYPVEVLLRGSVSSEVVSKAKPSVAIEVDVSVSKKNINKMGKKLTENKEDCQIGSQVVSVSWKNADVTSTIDSLRAFAKDHPKIVIDQALAVLSYKLEEEVLTDSALYGAESPLSDYQVRVLCYPDNTSCTITVRTATLVN